jgi:mono/diheme cytochrome c family protein
MRSSLFVGTGVAAGAAALALLAVAAVAQEGAGQVDAAAIYKLRCAMCHGPKGDSKLPGMSFSDGEWKHGSAPKEVATVIRDGVEGTAMLPFKSKLKDAEVDALAQYVRAFDPKLKANGPK